MPSLILISQSNEDGAWPILHCRSGYCTKVSVCNQRTGKAILNMIQGVEKVGAQCQLVALKRHRKNFHDAEIDIFHAVHEERIPPENRSIEVRDCQCAKGSARKRSLRSGRKAHAVTQH